MNFLAHTLLSCQNEQILVGNFIADSVTNKILSGLPEGIREGIHIHRQIDTYTDLHPKVRESARLLYPRHSKYAGVILDIYFDHFLSLHWDSFADIPLQEHAKKAYQALERNREWLPDRMQKSLPHMLRDNFLVNYGRQEGLQRSFFRMRSRCSRPERLDGVLETLAENFKALNRNFLAFFPDLQTYVRKELCSRIDHGRF